MREVSEAIRGRHAGPLSSAPTGQAGRCADRRRGRRGAGEGTEADASARGCGLAGRRDAERTTPPSSRRTSTACAPRAPILPATRCARGRAAAQCADHDVRVRSSARCRAISGRLHRHDAERGRAQCRPYHPVTSERCRFARLLGIRIGPRLENAPDTWRFRSFDSCVTCFAAPGCKSSPRMIDISLTVAKMEREGSYIEDILTCADQNP